MSNFHRIAVLMGGRSAERDVSLSSGAGVMKALADEGFDPVSVDPGVDLMDQLRAAKPDAVFNALHGRFGEDGTVQGALELLGIPYTGSGVMASAISIDKVMTKRVWLAEGVPTPHYTLLRRGAYDRARVIEIPDDLGLPLIVKPAREGSSLGVAKVQGYS